MKLPGGEQEVNRIYPVSLKIPRRGGFADLISWLVSSLSVADRKLLFLQQLRNSFDESFQLAILLRRHGYKRSQFSCGASRTLSGEVSCVKKWSFCNEVV